MSASRPGEAQSHLGARAPTYQRQVGQGREEEDNGRRPKEAHYEPDEPPAIDPSDEAQSQSAWGVAGGRSEREQKTESWRSVEGKDLATAGPQSPRGRSVKRGAEARSAIYPMDPAQSESTQGPDRRASSDDATVAGAGGQAQSDLLAFVS